MRAVKLLGLSVAVINVMYSAVYMGIAGSELYTVTDDLKTSSTILWVVGYLLYIVLNLTLFMRILAKDTVDFVVYLLFTGALSIARLIFLKYKKDNGELEVWYIVTDVYIILSIAIMLIVFVIMEKPTESYTQARTGEATSRSQNQSNVENAEKLEAGTAIQMEGVPLNNTHMTVQGNTNNVTINRSDTTFCCWYDPCPSYYTFGGCCSSSGGGESGGVGGGGGGEGGGGGGGGGEVGDGCCSGGCCGDDDGCCAGDDGCCNDGGCDDGCCDGGCEGDGACDGCGDCDCDGCGDGGCEGGDCDCGDCDL